MWYKEAIKEAPYLRDAFVELALLEYNLEKLSRSRKKLFGSLKDNNSSKDLYK